MILDFFCQRGIKRFVFIFVCLAALFWQKIIAVGVPCPTNSIISADNFLYSIADINIYWIAAIKLTLLLTCSYSFIIILSVNDVLPNRKYLAVLLFWTIVSVFADSQNFVNSLIALLFQLFAFYNIFCIYHSDAIKSSIFIAAFFVGISSMFSLSFILSSINIVVALLIFHVVQWRYIISIIAGLLTPFVFLLCFFQLAYHDINLMWQLIENSFNESILISFDNFAMLTTIFTGFVFLVGFFSIFKITSLKRTKSVYRMTNQLFYFIFFTSAIIFVALYGMQSYAITMFGISSAYLITRFSQITKRTWLIELIIFILLFAAIAYCNYSVLGLAI